MSFEITSIYQLLDLARDRPGMYGIGGGLGGKSYALLQSFLGGLSYAKLDQGDPPFRDFPRWASLRTGHYPTSRPLHHLRELPEEAGYDAWFALLDEYRTCRIVELARLPGSLARLRERWRHEPGKPAEPYMPPTPQAIRIGQFAPSNVFFIEQLFPDRGEKSYEFQPSVERAIDAALREWQVDPALWRLDETMG